MQVKPDMVFDPRTVIGWAMKQKPYFSPGAGYHYSNTNYLLLGLNTANYFFPEQGITVVAWVTRQANKLSPGVANAMFRDIARILRPDHVPFMGLSGPAVQHAR